MTRAAGLATLDIFRSEYFFCGFIDFVPHVFIKNSPKAGVTIFFFYLFKIVRHILFGYVTYSIQRRKIIIFKLPDR